MASGWHHRPWAAPDTVEYGQPPSFTAVEPRYPETYRRAAELFRTARARGFTVRSTVDCVIAALALEHGLAVLHSDRDYAALAKVAPLVQV